jgi:hypothetical protein
MNKVATYIKDRNGTGVGKVYALDPPLEGADHVWVSKTDHFVVETYIFASDSDGNVTDWLELPGSQQGDVTHEAALAGAGYEVVS